MLGNLKFGFYAIIAVAVGVILLNGNSGSSSGASTAQLDRALGIATDTANNFEATEGVNENNAMDKFASKYNEGLNSAQPPINAIRGYFFTLLKRIILLRNYCHRVYLFKTKQTTSRYSTFLNFNRSAMWYCLSVNHQYRI